MQCPSSLTSLSDDSCFFFFFRFDLLSLSSPDSECFLFFLLLCFFFSCSLFSSLSSFLHVRIWEFTWEIFQTGNWKDANTRTTAKDESNSVDSGIILFLHNTFLRWKKCQSCITSTIFVSVFHSKSQEMPALDHRHHLHLTQGFAASKNESESSSTVIKSKLWFVELLIAEHVDHSLGAKLYDYTWIQSW